MRLIWSRAALDDLKQIRDFIRLDNTEAAGEVLERILSPTSRLARHPGLGRPGRVSGSRELVLSGTPYVVWYRVQREVITVLRVVQGARSWTDIVRNTDLN